MSNFGYHTKEIPKGELGEFSKVQEEYDEFLDALEQDNPVMAIVELCDLYGAIKKYKEKRGIDYDLHLNYFKDPTYQPLMAMSGAMRMYRHDPSLVEKYLLVIEEAIHFYVQLYSLSLYDIKKMSDATERAFASGRRK